MKTLIVYNSVHHNNTEKIAKSIAEELNAEVVKLSDLENFNLQDYDLIGLGSGTYIGKYDNLILNLFDKFENVLNKRFFLFYTSGSKEHQVGNNFNKPLLEKIVAKGGKVISVFNCPGLSDYGLLKSFGGMNKGRPNSNDIEKVRECLHNLKPKVLTLCLTVKDNKVLLGMKKRGFGEGRWNGFGGKVEEGETILEAAKRETLEESGLVVKDIEERGLIDFNFMDTGKLMEVHIFDVLSYEGEPVETEEMSPRWFNLEEIPFQSMWPDDPYWFPLFLKKQKFKGRFVFKDNDIILSQEIDNI
jgi:8-oxo-dGTP diphosphatase/2-hydroxy-dATP diphosphatase